MVLKCIKNFHSKTLQNIPKIGMKIYHLASLFPTTILARARATASFDTKGRI
jgi:hypothetical protein